MSADEPELRGLQTVAPTPHRGCNPFAPLARILLLLLFSLGILYGILLVVTRTRGFLDLVARRATEAVGTPVSLGGIRLEPDFSLEIVNLSLLHPIPQARLHVTRARLRPDWAASLEARRLVYGRVEAFDIEAGVVEARDGSREPGFLLRRIGLDRWREPPPATAEKTASPSPFPNGEDTPPLPIPRLPIVRLNGNRMDIALHGLTLTLHDADGEPKLALHDLRVGIAPGRPTRDVVPPHPRYWIEGESAFPGSPRHPLRLDLLRNGHEWVLLQLEAESRLLFAVHRLLSGAPSPLVEEPAP